ncbi:MAG TPA: HD domain-containing protein [Nitrososphaeraceae archaeon]|nr:HD domain-containing protein [Nitrososphaeraceae archaeon]
MKLLYFKIITLFTTSNQSGNYKKSFSLYYYDLVRTLFVTLAFTGILSTGWFGIPLAPRYFTDVPINNLDIIFAIFSSLGSIWGIMAYREFTKTRDNILLVRDLCKKIDPLIGDYDYSTFNPITKKNESGYFPVGPTDFWDRETVVPEWLDKGKYWHIMLRLQIKNKEILLKVVKDNDLPFFSGKRNVATTSRENLKTDSKFKKKYRYVVCVPQWLVMNTELSNFSRSELNVNDSDFGLLMNAINKPLGLASNDITQHEKQRIKYSWKFSSLPIYLIKSLPIQIIYKEIFTKTAKYIPAQKKHIIEETNINLAYLSNDELIESLLVLARIKNIRSKSIEKINILLQFLKNEYQKLGLGDGSKRYHNLHHSLEVAYASLQMLPEELHGYYFLEEDYEYILVASLLHDYDPYQYNYKTSIGLYRFEGPKVENTIRELLKIRIIDAYFSMNEIEFKNYFRHYQYPLLPPVDYVTTHPEFVKSKKPLQSLIIETLIWRTDYPFTKKTYAQRNYYALIDKISHLIGLSEKYRLLSEVLSLSDLSVTYMSSDPINAWYRVTSLYEELNLPRSEAISRTDQFFSEIMKIELFQELLNNRNFSGVFKQRWNLVYQFYHEGNPSTQINRTIENAKIPYSKINLQIGVQTGDILYHIALEHKDEYFIGISTNEDAVLHIKDKFVNLNQQNVSCFWGDSKKLLPNLQSRSIDNILFILNNFPNFNNHNGQDSELLLLFKGVSISLKSHGTFQILTNINKNSEKEKEIIKIASKYGFQLLKSNDDHKIYFPQSYIPKEFFPTDSVVSLLVFHLYINSTIVG